MRGASLEAPLRFRPLAAAGRRDEWGHDFPAV